MHYEVPRLSGTRRLPKMDCGNGSGAGGESGYITLYGARYEWVGDDITLDVAIPAYTSFKSYNHTTSDLWVTFRGMDARVLHEGLLARGDGGDNVFAVAVATEIFAKA